MFKNCSTGNNSSNMRNFHLLRLKHTVLVILLSLFSLGNAEESFASFLNWGAGARSLGTGRAFVALVDDASALYWNPAALMRIKHMEMLFQQVMLFEGYSYTYAGFVFPMVDSTLGLDFAMIGASGFEGRDEDNSITGTFNDQKMAVSLAYSRMILANLFVGAKAKYISRALSDSSDMAISFDGSVMYSPVRNFTLGANFQNIVGMVMGDTADKLAMISRIGLAYTGDVYNIAMDVSDDMKKWYFGVEYYFFDFLPLRFGFNNNEISFGSGYIMDMFTLDFSMSMQELGSTMHFSMGLNLGGASKKGKMMRAEDYYELGKQNYKSGFYKLAYHNMKMALEFNSELKEAKERIAKLGKIISLVKTTLKQEKKAWPSYEMGMKKMKEGKKEEALKHFKATLAVMPSNTRVKMTIMNMELEKNKKNAPPKSLKDKNKAPENGSGNTPNGEAGEGSQKAPSEQK
jgi:hypothetical protein